MRTIIAGSRNFNNYVIAKSILDRCLWKPSKILSGGCKGADLLGERWAIENNIPVEVYPFKKEMGKLGGPLRNIEMAQNADACILFILKDAESKGSHNMLQNAIKNKLHLLVAWIA